MDKDKKQYIKNKIEKLCQEINHHDIRYYVFNQPEISDKEYDDLMRVLRKLEKDYPEFITIDSPTQRVSGQIIEEFKSLIHRQKMLSLDNTYSIEELREWEERVSKGLKNQKVEYVAELKIDGVSANLTYINGFLTMGATRGDGQTGEDVTLNLKTIRAIPLRLQSKGVPKLIEVRGEVYMEKKHLDILNKERAKNNEILFANPRNAAAGSLKLLDTNVVAKRHLNFFAHSLGFLEGETFFNTQWEFLNKIKSLGMRINPNIFLCKNLDQVIELCKIWEKKRDKLDYEIDGMVIKVNSLEQQKLLGTTLKSPRWAVAYKFTAHQATTRLLDIAVQVGRTGVLTPVAMLKSVECGGVTISRATLHNFDEIERLGIKIGDRVIVERAGDVIPKIIKVVESVRTGREKNLKIPHKCPECGQEVIKEKEEVAYRCINPSCPVQLEKGLLHFASRAAMDIEGMGESAVQELVRRKIVSDFSDLYFLKKDEFLKLPLFKDKKAENLVSAIELSKKRPLNRLLYGLGIRHVGEKAAYVLAERFGSLDKIMQSQANDFNSIYEVGQIMSESIVEFFRQPKVKNLIARLKKAGVNTRQPKAGVSYSTLYGKTFVFTGELKSFSRNEAEALVRQLGGNAVSGISKNTDFVVAGDSPGSKFEKAKSLGLKIIDEDGFKNLIKEKR